MNYKHGFKGHKLYGIWDGMKRRCYEIGNKNYKYYGKRGITVCDEWLADAGAFCQWALDNGWAEGLQLDRIDNDCGYFPENCRFVTALENNQNKRLIQGNNSTGYRGVHKNTSTGQPYKASVKNEGKQIHVGYFNTTWECAMARDKYIIQHGINQPLNFTEDSLSGRQLADAIEDWLGDEINQEASSSWELAKSRGFQATTRHEHRLAMIKWCLEQLRNEV